VLREAAVISPELDAYTTKGLCVMSNCKKTRRSTNNLAVIASLLLAAPMVTGAAADDKALERANALTAAYNASGQQLFERLADGPGNIVLSPYSIGTAMAMALSGARGDTEAEMIRGLKHTLGRTDIDAANADVRATLDGYDTSGAPPSCPSDMNLVGNKCESAPSSKGWCPFVAVRVGERCVVTPIPRPFAKLLSANSLMLTGQGDLISSDYVRHLSDKYGAEVFRNVGIADINGWVERKTEGKITNLIDHIEPNNAAVLLNAVYFKARWQSTFDTSDTKEEEFHLSSSSKIQIPMMHQESHFAFATGPGYRALRLPYQVAALSMIVVLPDDISGSATIAHQLDAQELSELFARLRLASRLVDLALPRFKATFKGDITSDFQRAGVTLAFDQRKADFSGATRRPASEVPLWISGLVHQALVEVAEEYTEAAAATGLSLAPASIPKPEEPERFRVDHPFLFYIVDDATKAILFEGRVADPR
jgi:serpin B